MFALVTKLSEITEVPISDLLKQFGRHLAKSFLASFPDFFKNMKSCFEFLPYVDSYVHLEVRKLYPDAELPKFYCKQITPNVLEMTYTSQRNLPDLAEGLILGCAAIFGESIHIEREKVDGDAQATLFRISVQGTV